MRPSAFPPRGICLNGLVIGTNDTTFRHRAQEAIFGFPNLVRGRVAVRPTRYGSLHNLPMAGLGTADSPNQGFARQYSDMVSDT